MAQQSTARHRCRRRRILLPLLLVLLGCGIGWQWQRGRTHEYQFIAFYPSSGYTCLSCDAGFLLQDVQGPFVFRDWHGRQQWRITKKQFSGKSLICHTVVSADGRTIGMLMTDKKRLYVQQWRDGRLLGEVPHPFSRKDAPLLSGSLQMRTLADGSICYWSIRDHTLSYATLRNGRLAALPGVSCPKA